MEIQYKIKENKIKKIFIKKIKGHQLKKNEKKISISDEMMRRKIKENEMNRKYKYRKNMQGIKLWWIKMMENKMTWNKEGIVDDHMIGEQKNRSEK